MPRITKVLPADRTQWTFGDLVYWHLFKYGTRPAGDPNAEAGKIWEFDSFCGLLGISDRTLRNWINDRNLPDSIVPLAAELFGDNAKWDKARLELQQKFELGWAKRGPKVKAGAAPSEGAPVAPDVEPAKAESREQPSEAKPSQSDRRVEDERIPVGRSLVPAAKSDDAQTDARRKRVILTGIAASLAILIGGSAWLKAPRAPSSPAPEKVVVVKTDPTPPAAPGVAPTAPVIVVKTDPTAPPPVVPDKGTATPDKPDAGVTPPPTVPAFTPPAPVTGPTPPTEMTEDEKQAAERRRLAEQLVAARLAAFEAKKRKDDEDARRRDQQAAAAVDATRDRDNEARTLAGLGFRLTENQSIPGTSISHVQVETVAECALACTRESCDAFGFYRLQYPIGTKAKRYCYLYRKPFAEPANNPGYVLGQPVSETMERSEPTLPRIILVQATTPAPDDLTRCSSGPVRATGFALACDEILGGGTAPGGQERFAVRSINDYAARCRPNKSCTGFTFNSADPEGRRACQLFGGNPEGRESPGWISGRRQ